MYDLNSFGLWIEKSHFHTEHMTNLGKYSADDWMVEVEFKPAAPLVANYFEMVENLTAGIRWEGEITLGGEIDENSYSE